MGKGKLAKWKELATFDRVFEPTLQEAIDGKDFEFRGNWSQQVFGNDHPIILELGCGKGEYTIAQARKNPDCNFIGVDIKGQRVWKGAKTINDEYIRNVAFLRTRIEFIEIGRAHV